MEIQRILLVWYKGEVTLGDSCHFLLLRCLKVVVWIKSNNWNTELDYRKKH